MEFQSLLLFLLDRFPHLVLSVLLVPLDLFHRSVLEVHLVRLVQSVLYHHLVQSVQSVQLVLSVLQVW